ncbi:MAG TPA: M14 family metallopeptidase [Luteimonas sp.]|nr:M14 family metallopeptidase [Luteimonas sp.]
MTPDLHRRVRRRADADARVLVRTASWLPALLVLLVAGCATRPPLAPPAATVATASTDDSRALAQVRRDWRFDEDGIGFDNRLPAARLSGVERLGDGLYRIDIAPEAHPINPSPWYGFRIRSDAPRALELRFAYPHDYRHRYTPKLSDDGRHWREADGQAFEVDADGNARLRLQLEAGELRVFAQPPFLPDDSDAWSARVAAQVGAQLHAFGSSVQGRPLQMFEFGAGADAPLLLVVGRQHPPENTGSQALTGFVEALAADTPQARAFRGKVHVLVVPLLNPDGVVEGHWRGNANGVDLNRDWGPFVQPETRALRELLAARGIGPGRVAFAIDFHSTFRDVFYTVTEDPSRAPGGVLHAWMAAMQARFDIDDKPSAARSPVFKNWAFCRLGAPAVTYEVGDTTPVEVLGEVARHAAHSLMTLLADAPVPVAAPACPSFTG